MHADALALAQIWRPAALAVDSARLYRELQEAVRIREDFLASAGHDLRSPLTVIRGHAQLLRRQMKRSAGENDSPAFGLLRPLLDSLTPALNHIEAATTKMGRLIGALLDAARIQAGQALSLDTGPTTSSRWWRVWWQAPDELRPAPDHAGEQRGGAGGRVGCRGLERMLDNQSGTRQVQPSGGAGL